MQAASKRTRAVQYELMAASEDSETWDVLRMELSRNHNNTTFQQDNDVLYASLLIALEAMFGEETKKKICILWSISPNIRRFTRNFHPTDNGLPPGYLNLSGKSRDLVDKVLSSFHEGDCLGMETHLESLANQRWQHSDAYLALSLCGRKADADQVQRLLVEYGSTLQDAASWDPIILLAAVRSVHVRAWSPSNAMVLWAFYRYTFEGQALRFTNNSDSNFLTSIKQNCLQPAAPETNHVFQWDKLRQSIKVDAMDDLLRMVGISSVKQEILDLVRKVLADKHLIEEQRVPYRLNFTFFGNPGTGKTTAARLIGKILHEIGARKSDAFVETTGQQLVQDGAVKFDTLISAAMNGVLFIDEAHSLDPRKNSEGPGIVTKILKLAEDDRDKITIILAGYQDDIECKLYAVDQGFQCRFKSIIFEDFSEVELEALFMKTLNGRKWEIDARDPGLPRIAARRLARRRSTKGFANARTVREAFESASLRSSASGRAPTLRIEDILGERPDPQKIPELKDALDSLERMVGLREKTTKRKGAGQAVKDAVDRMIKTAQANYDRELRGEKSLPLTLNRLFLGNPGTGKTSIAEIYGKILKNLNLLSIGTVVQKVAGDFISGHEGGTEEATLAIIENARGKVLVIDEAYVLNDTNYGNIALNMIVSKVMGTPGEDIAVLLLGYEQKMLKMLREQNPGLSGRFNPENAFFFPDYDDSELRTIFTRAVESDGLEASFTVRNAAVKLLGQERLKPNFRNAGAVNNLISRAKERMSFRDPLSNELLVEDLGVSSQEAGIGGDPLAELHGLCRVEHIVEAIREIQAVASEKRRLGQQPEAENYLFVGNPGTGKTTVARIMGRVMSAMGVLADKPPVETTAGEIQAKYVGHSAAKAQELLADARGGILFVDEAHGLADSAFSREAAKGLMTGTLEEGHKGKTMLIFAGYKEEMEAMIQAVDPGMRRRFKGTVEFPDWTPGDCVHFVRLRCDREGLLLEAAAEGHLLEQLTVIRERPGWGNASDAVDTFEYLFAARAVRLAGAAEAEPTFTLADARKALSKFLKQRPEGGGAIAHRPAAEQFAAPPTAPEVWQAARAVVRSARPAEAEALGGGDGDGEEDDMLAVALEAACVELGYDRDHESRSRLLAVLAAVDSGAGDFPDDILECVRNKTGRSAGALVPALRPQVSRLLASVREVVDQEVRRREEEQRLEEERRQAEAAAAAAAAASAAEREAAAARQRDVEAQIRAVEAARRRDAVAQRRLATMGLCPAGYSWFRVGGGWRCCGGSHFVMDAQLGL